MDERTLNEEAVRRLVAHAVKRGQLGYPSNEKSPMNVDLYASQRVSTDQEQIITAARTAKVIPCSPPPPTGKSPALPSK